MALRPVVRAVATRPLLAALGWLVAGLAHPPGAFAGQRAAPPPACRLDGPVARLPLLAEASGLALSRREPTRLWSHNDSGQPVLFALDSRGAVAGRLRITNAAVGDWEAVATGPCPAGSCVYVADIGDNDATRGHITIYRVPEPATIAAAMTAAADVFRASYPDGAHDAEALLVTPDGLLYIVTKGDREPVGLYRFARDMRPGVGTMLERVGGSPGTRKKTPPAARVTDGSVSPDGRWVVLRTARALTFHRTAEFTAGNWQEARRVDLASLEEPQGEGVAIGPDDVVYVAGEGGGKGRPGTFAHLSCAPLP
jgi:hypothetical protein